jgi:hypothetical protein
VTGSGQHDILAMHGLDDQPRLDEAAVGQQVVRGDAQVDVGQGRDVLGAVVVDGGAKLLAIASITP